MTSLDKPSRTVRRVTNAPLGYSFGADRERRLVVSLEYGDLICLRPLGTRREERVLLADVYTYAIRCRVNSAKMAKLREKKIQKQQARERRALLRSIHSTT